MKQMNKARLLEDTTRLPEDTAV